MDWDRDEVERAALDLQGAAERLKRAVRQAVENGAPIAHVAEAAGVSRQTIYNWLAEE